MGGLYIPRPIVEVAPSTRRRLDYVTIRDTPPVPPMADGKVACKHLVLVHGACIGGWTYFKVATRLRSAGYRVTALDLGASGVDPRPLRVVPTFRDYTAPLLGLLGSLPPGEKVVLVGHSLGGINVALAAELFPDKIAAAVFLCAFMPDHTSRPSHVLEKFIEGKWLDWMDTEFKPQDAEGKLPTSMLFGPQIAQERLMQLCSPESTSMCQMEVSPRSRLRPCCRGCLWSGVPAAVLVKA
ncbi:putative inactive methylesterase 20 isoform X2 [Oryza glaberrima]|uniref:putative inactive methylesterase 20 isoform X2 n=1 Tax=Oryza glaberrima TaxID=4538 RepID=UPI00224BE71E|nr:putative inactive methylesterase 20 isoform X2 [Oryza glaberrima]